MTLKAGGGNLNLRPLSTYFSEPLLNQALKDLVARRIAELDELINTHTTHSTKLAERAAVHLRAIQEAKEERDALTGVTS